MLGDRLQLLQQAGLLRRTTLPPPAASACMSSLAAAAQTGAAGPGRLGLPLLDSPRDQDAYRLSWLALTLKQRFDPEAAREVNLTWELRVDDEVLHIIIDNGTVQIVQGPARAPEVVLVADCDTFLAWAAASWTTTRPWRPAFG